MTEPAAVSHLVADLTGVGSGALRDAPMLSGLLIAAAGAAGLGGFTAPVVRTASDGGVAAILLLEPCHLSVHSFPDRGLALVDHCRRWRLKVAPKPGGFEDQPRGSHAVKRRQRLPRLNDGVRSDARRR